MEPPQPQTLLDAPVKRDGPRPMVPLALAMMTGIVAARFFPVPLPLLYAFLLLLILVWVSWVQRIHPLERSNVHFFFLAVFCMLLGAGRMEFQHNQWHRLETEVQSISQLGAQTIAGTVAEIRSNGSGGSVLVLDDIVLNRERQRRLFSPRLELHASNEQIDRIHIGDRIRFQAEVWPIRGSGLPISFDSQEYRYNRHIFAAVYLEMSTDIERLESSSSSSASIVRGIAYSSLKQAEERLDDSGRLHREALALVSSIALGLRSNMPPDLDRALSASGLAHITSISGLHVTLVLWIMFFVLKRCGLKRKQAAWFTAALAVFYVVLVGARIPTLRSALMAFVLLGKHLVQRRVDPFNSLALAAVVLLLLNPAELFSASFQLSFAAVLALLLAAPLYLWFERGVRPIPLAWLCQGTVASLAVVVALAPFTVHYFHIVPWGAVLGNLIAVPVVFLFLPVSYAWILSIHLPFDWLTALLEQTLLGLCTILLAVIHCFSEALPLWNIVPDPGILFSAMFLLGLLFLVRPWVVFLHVGEIPIRSYTVALGCFCIAVWGGYFTSINQPLRIDFLSLGQCDAACIRTPGGRTVLIDGGRPAQNRGYRFTPLENYLLSNGIKRIDAMILSHPQADHIGEFASVARRFPVKRFLECVGDGKIKHYRELIDVLQEKRVPKSVVRMGDRVAFDDGVMLWVLSPADLHPEAGENINESSVVVLLQYRGFRALFTGDIGKATEAELCERYGDWDVDVVKIPHHGSFYSSSQRFIDETRPEFAVASVGHNSYGHPNAETLERYRKSGAQVFRTDFDGTVRVTTDGDGYRIYTTRSNRVYWCER